MAIGIERTLTSSSPLQPRGVRARTDRAARPLPCRATSPDRHECRSERATSRSTRRRSPSTCPCRANRRRQGGGDVTFSLTGAAIVAAASRSHRGAPSGRRGAPDVRRPARPREIEGVSLRNRTTFRSRTHARHLNPMRSSPNVCTPDLQMRYSSRGTIRVRETHLRLVNVRARRPLPISSSAGYYTVQEAPGFRRSSTPPR